MMRLPIAIVFLLTLAALHLTAAPEPELKVTPTNSGGITIQATDTEGLDSLEVICRAADLRYHTTLAGAAPTRTFQRTFTLPELFPPAKEWKNPVDLEVIIRNTRGATATVTVQASPRSSIPNNRQ